ncbi:TonB-dependent siderophore receptor [Paraflavitalea sp. CAU 1676]|uniref:TonB-dependent siderophore receptor n=1 Tax=Paraflavitalea sp. CAU 1676 TaxID=3032598 RepID=UPI0023DC825C|nr:TonB-dependent siderophore receptor [Paraflavitalea sp. CAU 1676]MDF2190576.1 TonB-dependent siderophore receptor [Paraflavitalea sp. CAU 1676]
MQRYTALLLAGLFLLGGPVWAQQGTGTIKGHITTNDDRSAAWVTVLLKGTKRTVSSDEQGNFIIKNVKAGTYQLEASLIGYESSTKEVTVEENKTVTISIPLSVSNRELQEVIVRSSKGVYNAKQGSASLRLNEPLLEAPQNIQVVTSANLADQQVISMSDGVIRNISGAVRLEHWGDMYTNIHMRGSQIQAFRNGFNVVSSFWGPLTEDMSIVDHIEFVKGPAGFMLANGDPSGMYNVVTKKPTGQSKGEASLTVGSYDLYRAALDLDGKLSKDGKLLYRLNLAAQNKKSFRDFEYNNRYTFAPVISYQVDEKTKITAEYVLQNARMSDVGSFYVFNPNGYAALPRNTTFLQPGLEPTKINDHSFSVNVQHDLNEDWKLTAQAAYYNYQQKGTSMWPGAVNPDGKVIRSVGLWDAKSEMTLAQVFVNGKLQTGSVQHRILGGLDMGNKQYFADWSQSHALDSVGAEFDPLNPNYGTPVNGFPVWDRSLSLEARSRNAGGDINQRYTGIYVSDELGFFDNTVRLTLAGRYTYVSQSNFGGAAEEAKRVTPRIGLSVNLDRNTTVYGLYDEAFLPQAGHTRDNSKIRPITGGNIEFGIKRDWFNGRWNTTASIYRIIKNNELTADPTNGSNENYSVVIGQKKAEGFELDIRGTLIKNLNIVANYAYTDGKFTEVAPGTIYKVGQVVPGFSRHTVNSWVNYKLSNGPLKGLGISGGFTWLLDRATAEWSEKPFSQDLPDYFKLDAGLFYEKDRIKLSLNVFNVLDKYLYTGSYYDWLSAFYWQAEAPRTVRFGINYKF